VKRLIGVLAASVLVAAALVLGLGGKPAASDRHGDSLLHSIAVGDLRAAQFPIKARSGGNALNATKPEPFVSSGTLAALGPKQMGDPDEKAVGGDLASGGDVDVDHASGGGDDTGAGPAHTLGCGNRTSNGNARVNQDCTYRRQAEEDIVANPTDPNNLAAGQNDSRVGFNQCGIDFSTNNGRNWGDMLPPFRSHENDPASMEAGVNGNPNRNTIQGGPGTHHTYDADSDPTVAFDSQGRAFFACVMFDDRTNASGVFVTQSPQGAEGSFYYNVGIRSFMVVEDNTVEVAHDKEFITADTYASSPNRDNVYVTWTVFKFGAQCLHSPDADVGYCESPIFGSMSTDHGRTWSTPEEISGVSDAFCQFAQFFGANAPKNACNFDQGSDPAVLPNGDLFVVFNNGNTPSTTNHQLGVLCHPSGSSPGGTAHLNCANPAIVGNDEILGEPECDFGRGPEECIPGAFIRTNDFPRIVTNTQSNHLYVTWQDYRNGEFDIQLSQSLDGGHTWHEVGTVNPEKGLDHYFPAVDQSPRRSDRVGDSYYRTERVPGETSPANCILGASDPSTCTPFAPGVQPGVAQSNSDYVLAGGNGSSTPFAFKTVSPVFPPPDGIQTGFNGDYSGLIISKSDDAHPIWSDTRNVDPFAPTNGVTHDEDVFTDNVGLPNGNGRRDDNGHVGKGGDRR
jgi:hypothetical protein